MLPSRDVVERLLVSILEHTDGSTAAAIAVIAFLSLGMYLRLRPNK